MRKLVLALFVACVTTTIGQNIRPLKLWEEYPFVTFTTFHPSQIIKADNNWDVIMSFRKPHSVKYLDSIGVHAKPSQLILLNIEGLIKYKDGNWQTCMPIMDSLQTATIRHNSALLAQDVCAQIKDDVKGVVRYCADTGYKDNAFSLIFSYILDNKCWDELNINYSGMMDGATWQGLYYILYNKRDFLCGTNSLPRDSAKVAVTWGNDDPDFASGVYSFIGKLCDEYVKNGKITNRDLLDEAVSFGLADTDGNITIPVIDETHSTALQDLSTSICKKIKANLEHSKYVDDLMSIPGITDKRMAIIIFYHELMYDMLECMVKEKLISLPRIWTSDSPAQFLFKDVVYIQKG